LVRGWGEVKLLKIVSYSLIIAFLVINIIK
jgi:hypothetical protein